MAPCVKRVLRTIIEAISGSVSTSELCINCIIVSYCNHDLWNNESTNVLMGLWQSIVGLAVGTHSE